MPQRKGLGYYFFTFINKLSDMIIISIVFVLTCIPVITMGAAGTALYYTVQKVIKRGQGYLLKEYFGAFKRNFKQCTLVWIFFLLPMLALFTAMFILNEYRILGFFFGNFFVIPGAVIIILAAYQIGVFSYMARFEGGIKEVLKNALIIGVLNPGRTVACTILFFAGFAAVFYILPLFIILPGLICYCFTVLLESAYRRYMTEEVSEEEDKLDHAEDPSSNP